MAVRLTVLSFLVLVSGAPTVASQGGSATATNAATLTITGGPDQGTYTLEVPARVDGRATCRLRPRPDGQAGQAFAGSFYPAMNDNPGLMEVTTTFDIDAKGHASGIHAAVTFLVGKPPALDMRVYEVETRASKTADRRGSATVTRRGSAAAVRVEAETADGVKFAVDLDCRTVAEK